MEDAASLRSERHVLRLRQRHEHVAQLVAAGAAATHAYITAGYSEKGAAQSAARLLKDPAVRARIEEVRRTISARLTDCSIREVDARVRALQDRWELLNRIIIARGADPDHRKAPGGETGLLVRTLKPYGRGEEQSFLEEFSVDTGLLRELRELEKQAAQELGQWTERSEASVEVTIEQRLVAARARLQKT